MLEYPEIRNNLLQELASFREKEVSGFPIHVFPEQIQRIINEAHKKLNFPPEFLGSSILFAASIAIGNTHRFKVKNGYITSGVVWVALVGNPGVNKSHPLKFAVQPILNKDAIAHYQYALDCETFANLEELTDKQRKELGYDYMPGKPILKKHLVQDFTPEAFASLHKNNLRGVGIYMDELMGWINNFNRYNKGSDQESALQLWSGHPLSVDRKNSPSIYIQYPFVPVAGTIQPVVLTGLGKNKGNGNGFLDRFLFAAPTHLKKEAWSEDEIDDQLVHEYHEIIERLFALPFEPTCTSASGANAFGTILELDSGAKQILYNWQMKDAAMTNEMDSHALKGYYNKMDSHVPRLILLLHLLKCASAGERNTDGRKINVHSVEAGIVLGEYYRKQAEHVFEQMFQVSAIEKLNAKSRLFYETLPQVFKRKEILLMAEEAKIPTRTLDRTLSDRELFIKTRNGEYEKVF